MKNDYIERIEIYKLAIPLKEPITAAFGTFDRLENLAVRIFDRGGRYGTGEAAPFLPVTGETRVSAWEAAGILGSALPGRDAAELEDRVSDMNRLMQNNTSVKAAFDTALYDLAARKAGLPLYAFLGGNRREIPMDITVGMDSPEKMAAGASGIVNRGITSVKLKLGGPPAEDIRRVRAVRDALGPDVRLRIDPNQGWTLQEALGVLDALRPMDIEYCEQPVAVWNTAAMKRLTVESGIPIMADEALFDQYDAFKLAAGKVCDFFNIKLAKSGGIHNALKISAVAEAAGIQCMVGCMLETRLGLSAAAHLAAGRANIVFADLDAAFFLAEDPVIGGITYKDGQVILPDIPGHGADFSEDYLASLESTIFPSARRLDTVIA